MKVKTTQVVGSVLGRAELRTETVDALTHPAVAAAATTEHARQALALAVAFDQAANDAARLLRHARDVAGTVLSVVDQTDADAVMVHGRAAVAANVAQWLAPVADQARVVANSHAVAALVELASLNDPTTDAGTAVRRVAAARYGVRIGPTEVD